jgi:hypothetical protein
MSVYARCIQAAGQRPGAPLHAILVCGNRYRRATEREVTLKARDHRTGRLIRFPLRMADLNGCWSLGPDAGRRLQLDTQRSSHRRRCDAGTGVLIPNRQLTQSAFTALHGDDQQYSVWISAGTSLGPACEFGRSGSALAFLGEDAACAYLDRVGQVIVIWQDENDRTAFAREATVALGFVTVQP